MKTHIKNKVIARAIDAGLNAPAKITHEKIYATECHYTVSGPNGSVVISALYSGEVVLFSKDELRPSAQEQLNEAQELIYQVLEHISAGRYNEDLIKQKLIQAAKNLPCPLHSGLSKYN